MIQSVEGIGCQFELLLVVIVTFQAEGFREAQVKIGIARPMTRIPSDAQWTVIEYGVPLLSSPVVILNGIPEPILATVPTRKPEGDRTCQ